MPESDVRSVASVLSSTLLLHSWCLTSTETIRLIRDGKKGGGDREEMNSSSAIRFVKTEETFSHRQNSVQEVGTPSEFRSCVKVEVAVLDSPS